MSEEDETRLTARRALILESKAEIQDDRIQSQKHEEDLAEHLYSDWPAYSGVTKYGPVTGSTYGGGGYFWREPYYWIVAWLILCFCAIFVIFLVALLISGRISF